MKMIKNIGLSLFIVALTVFVLLLTLSNHTLTREVIVQQVGKKYHQEMLISQASDLLGKTYSSNVAFVKDLRIKLGPDFETCRNRAA